MLDRVRLPNLSKVEWLVVTAIVILISAMLGQTALRIINYTDSGTITKKKYHPAWVQMTTTYANDVPITIPVSHPQKWTITIANGDKYATFDVPEKLFNEMAVGDEFDATELGVSRQ